MMKFARPAYALMLALALSALPAPAAKYETTLSIHPMTLGISVFKANARWLSVTLEQAIVPSLSVVATPVMFSHDYSTHTEGWFDSDFDRHYQMRAKAFYLGPRYYPLPTDQPAAFLQGLVKYSTTSADVSGDTKGSYRQSALGALVYWGFKAKGRGIMGEFNMGVGKNFHEFENVRIGDDFDAPFFEELLIDVNFCVGFHT